MRAAIGPERNGREFPERGDDFFREAVGRNNVPGALFRAFIFPMFPVRDGGAFCVTESFAEVISFEDEKREVGFSSSREELFSPVRPLLEPSVARNGTAARVGLSSLWLRFRGNLLRSLGERARCADGVSDSRDREADCAERSGCRGGVSDA